MSKRDVSSVCRDLKYSIHLLENEEENSIDFDMAIQYARRAVIQLIRAKANETPPGRNLGERSAVRRGEDCLAAICCSQEPVNISSFKDDVNQTIVMITSYDVTGVDELLTFHSELIPDIIKQLKKIHKESDR